MVSTRYQVLFSITIKHDYYGVQDFDDLLIEPDEATRVQLRNYKILYRVQHNVLTAMIQTENNKPFIAIGDGTLFRFLLTIKQGAFMNFSALKMANRSNGIYYFSNRSNNKKNNGLFLSVPVPLYKNTETYEMGSVVRKGSRVFECTRGNSTDNRHDTTDTESWRDIVLHQAQFLPAYAGTNTYVAGDLVKLGQKVFECLQANSATNQHDTADTSFWQEITEIPYVSNADIITAAAIGGNPVPSNTFGVIDIFHGDGEPATFNLLTATGEVKATPFFIRFKNRSTTWKYISTKNAVTAITDTNAIYTFSNDAVNNEFVSQVPIPLSFVPLQSIRMKATVNNRPLEITGIQNPVANIILPTDNTSNYQLISAIYLNY